MGSIDDKPFTSGMGSPPRGRFRAAPLPGSFARSRDQLRLVATHVLARARWTATGRFGLRVTPGGIGTPAFGDEDEVLRFSGRELLREHRPGDGARTDSLAVPGRSLEAIAAFADVALDTELSVGEDTPPIVDARAPLRIDGDALDMLFEWFALGGRALDHVVSAARSPSVVQLWPEHFDVAVDVDTRGGRVNLGASPGDDRHPSPYLYVGPWSQNRPGDPDYWNAPFGATLTFERLRDEGDPHDAAEQFFVRGLAYLD